MTQSFQIHVKFKHVKVAVKRTVDKKKNKYKKIQLYVALEKELMLVQQTW